MGGIFLVKKLQEILEFEYTDIFTYNNEANLFKEKIKDREQLFQIYKNFALEELTHADIISKQISSLGEIPFWEYKNIFVSNSIRESLKLHLDREITVYKTYIDLIKQVEDRELKILLKGIRDNEKGHIEQISKFLKKIAR